jgi:hypothetical protein
MRILAALALFSASGQAVALSAPRGWSRVEDAPSDLILDLTFMLTLPKNKVTGTTHAPWFVSNTHHVITD